MADNAAQLHPAVLGADTIDLQTGESPILDGLTKGLGSAVISGVYSIYNTFNSYVGKDQIDVARQIEDYDQNWGEYYRQHQLGVDVTGFVGTSLIPGALGIKGLKLAQSGEALGAIGRGLGYASSRRSFYLNDAMEQLAASGGTVTRQINVAKWKSFGWATADQTLQATAAEFAIAATMNQSPIFEGDDIWDFAKTMAIGAAFGGAVGGVLESFAVKGILVKAQDAIQVGRREHDVIFNPDRLGMIKGNEILAFAENIVKTSDDFANVNFNFRPIGESKQVTKVLNTGEAFERAYDQSQRIAFDKIAMSFNELAGGNEAVGQGFYRFIRDKIKEGKAAGRDPQDITEEIAGYLMNTVRARPILESELNPAKLDPFYIRKEADSLEGIFAKVRGKDTTKQAYYIEGGEAGKEKIVVRVVDDISLEGQRKAFFETNADIIITREGHAVVNPKSKIVRAGEDQALRKSYFLDLENGTVTPDAVLRAADLMRRAGDWNTAADAIYVGGKKFVQATSNKSVITANPQESSARFMWASGLTHKFFANRTIDIEDIPLIERLLELNPQGKSAGKIKIRNMRGVETPLDQYTNLRLELNTAKLEILKRDLTTADGIPKGRDTRGITTALNITQKQFEEAVQRSFAPTREWGETNNPIGKYFEPTTIAIDYGVQTQQFIDLAGPIGPGHEATRIVAHQYELKVRQLQTENASNAALDEYAKNFQDIESGLTNGVSETGSGANTWTSSNADYGRKANLFVQEVGKQLTLAIQKQRDSVIAVLNPVVHRIKQDKSAAAELGILTTALRRDPQTYKLISEPDPNNSKKLVYRLVDRDAFKMGGGDLEEAIQILQGQGRRGSYEVKSEAVGEFLEQSRNLNKIRVDKTTTLLNATGLARKMDGDSIHVPAVDTRRYPYFAFVRAKDKIGGESSVSMITAKSEDELRLLASKVDTDEFDVIYKADTERFFKARGEYDYSSGINESRVNSEMKRVGRLGDFFPETRAENVLEDYLSWHARGEETLLRRAIEVKYRQFFSELDHLSDQFTQASTSVAKGKVALLEKQIADPFRDYRNTALALSKQSEFPVLNSLNEFIDSLGRKAYTALDNLRNPMNGLVDFDKANKLIKEYGLPQPYKGIEEYITANTRYPKNLFADVIRKANYYLASLALRLDFANAIINAISLPVLMGMEYSAIKKMVAGNDELAGKLLQLTSIKVPGQEFRMPSLTRLVIDSSAEYMGPTSQALVQRFKDNGDIKGISRLYHEALDDLSFREHVAPNLLKEKMDRGIETLSKLTGNELAEEFTRFTAANVMKKLTDPLLEAGRMSLREQNSYISSFVNRVQGNYTASQRPIVFQGTTGAAISLFQTYMFNVLQQLTRHMENRNSKALLTFAGLQSSVYGLNGLPFFDAVNTQLIGKLSANPEHHDIYSAAQNFNRELGDWMMYGTASAFPLFGDRAPALYTRGDMNPRHVSIIPILPQDVPAVSASIKLVGAVKDFGSKVMAGADLSTSFLQALEHHGINRPLAGFAQLLAGEVTTSKGSLVSAANDLETTSYLTRVPSRIVNFGGATRLLGAKPMDEALALERLYRDNAYKAADSAKLETIGRAIKTKLRDNQMPSEEEMNSFMEQYAIAGGRIETFSRSLQHWSRDANVSIVNQLANKVNSRYGRSMQQLMGADRFQDYSIPNNDTPSGTGE